MPASGALNAPVRPAAAPEGDDLAVLLRVQVARPRHPLAHRRAHLHRRAFPAERQARPDADDAAEELDDRDAHPADRVALLQHLFDVRDAAARRLRRDPPHHPHRDEDARRHRRRPGPGRRPTNAAAARPSVRRSSLA